MRRGLGAAGHMQKKKMQEKAQEAGAKMEQEHLMEMKSQLDEFKTHLEKFAMEHKKEISSNPVFRAQFM
jgi:ESCRT-II complex subunit VPS22